MSRRGSDSGVLHLVRRQLATDRSTVVVVAVTVLLLGVVLTAWPRSVHHLLGADAREQVATLTPALRDPTVTTAGFPMSHGLTDPLPDVVDQIPADLRRTVAENAGPALTQVLGDPQFALTRAVAPIDKGPRAPDVTAMGLAVRIDPAVGDRVRLVDGTLPGPVDLSDVPTDADGVPVLPVVDVLLSADSADRMDWQVGETRPLLTTGLTVRLSGVFEAVDPAAGYWSHLESTLFPSVIEDGNYGTTVNGTAYADVSAGDALTAPTGMVLEAWFPVDTAAVARVDRDALTAELRGFDGVVGAESDMLGVLESVAARQSTVTTILDVLAVGPLAAALGVLWLASVLAVDRRRAALTLARARGATATDLGVVLALQGLAVALPAGAAGALVGTLLVPGADPRVGDYLLPAVVTLAPAVLLALAGARVGAPRSARSAPAAQAALARGRVQRRRWLVELLVVALAAFAVAAVRQRGLSTGASGTDPLLVATPVLLALAACVLVLRLYPVPVRALARALHRTRGLPHVLGAARAARAPAAGLAPVVALVLGVSVVVLSGVVLSTVRAGITETATQATGADLRLDGHVFTDADLAAVRSTAGVAAATPVGLADNLPITIGRASRGVDVVTVDAAALTEVQDGLPGLSGLPGALVDGGTGDTGDTAAGGSGLTAVMSARSKFDLTAPMTMLVGPDFDPVPFDPVGERTSIPGVASGTDWLVVDRALLRERTGMTDVVDRVLVRLTPGADAGTTLAAVEAAVGFDLDGTTPGEAAAALRHGALVRGTEVGLLVVTGLSAVLCVLVLAMTLLVGAPARGRLFAMLTTLGAPSRTGRVLVLWEVVPVVLVAVLTGLAVGAALPSLLLGVADLRLFTGGAAQPPVVADPVVFALVGSGVVVAVTLATLAATVLARRTGAAHVLREGEGA